MSLLKPRRLTPAMLLANRRNALKSTGPRTAAGKGRSSLNALRSGGRSKTIARFFQALLHAPPGELEHAAAVLLRPEERNHPVVADLTDWLWKPLL